MERNKKVECLLIGMLLLQVVVSLALFPVLPERMPTHWDVHGQVDGWMGRLGAMAVFFSLSLSQYLLLWAIPYLDPKGKIAVHQKAYNAIRLTVQLLLLLVFAAVMAAALDVHLSVPQLCFGATSIMLVILGNYMGKIRPNYFMGIRTPWTLEDPMVWQKTHRVGGPVFILAGLFSLAGSLWSPIAGLVILVVSVMAASVYLVGYSWVQYKRLHSK